MSDDNASVMITAVADRNFVTILNAYKHLKTIKKLTLISVLIMTTMMIYLVPDVLMSSIQTAGSPALVPFNIQQRALEHSF